jgi:hypothetical protein
MRQRGWFRWGDRATRVVHLRVCLVSSQAPWLPTVRNCYWEQTEETMIVQLTAGSRCVFRLRSGGQEMRQASSTALNKLWVAPHDAAGRPANHTWECCSSVDCYARRVCLYAVHDSHISSILCTKMQAVHCATSWVSHCCHSVAC